MSAELLKKLRVKNAPAPKVKVMVNIPEEIKTKIKDQRNVGKITRKDFMLGIKPQVGRVSSIPEKPKKPVTKTTTKHSLALPPELRMEIIGKREKKLKLESVGSAETKTVARKTVKPADIVLEGTVPEMRIGDEILSNRLGEKPEEFRVRASSYYMNNRKIFMNFMSSIFEPYKKEIKENAGKASCERGDGKDFSLKAHQKIVSDYINLYTPYRGLLLYHGLGSGKTCTSIAIAEGIKTSRAVIVMTPASLRMNYVEELKKCGDSIYKKISFGNL